MTEGEKRIAIVMINYAKGKYDLAYLKDVLARGLKHLDERGAGEVGQRFISNLAAIEIAIDRIERSIPTGGIDNETKKSKPKSPTQQRSAAFCKFLAQDHHCQGRSEEWVEVYIRFLEACKAYALHPQTPDSVAAAIIGGLKRLRERLREEDWIPEELDA